MKNKIKKTLLIILPIVVAIMMAIMFSLPSNFEKGRVEQTDNFATADTGAGTAPVSDKGGVLFLEQGATYKMTGGTFTGKNKKYGGAVFISSGATFEMSGGSITNNSATYGGGIYVQAGGTCKITGGEISGNTANYGPAIYVEEGAIFELGSGATVDNNEVYDEANQVKVEIGEEVVVGKTSSSLKLKTITFGTYPQHYVGTSMNAELESWFSEDKQPVQEYVIDSSTTWKAYEYTDGNIYARGSETKRDSDSKYSDGTLASTGRIGWFKVEPITWYILNYEAWKSGTEDMEIFSTTILTGKVKFNASTSDGNSWETSDIREWCNGSFLNSAFTSAEQGMIKETIVKNNVTNDYNKETSDQLALATTDKIYLKSYWEMYDPNGLFKGSSTNCLCSGSDFAIGNNLVCSGGTSYATAYGSQGSTYWLRSAGSSASYACSIGTYGHVYDYYSVYGDDSGVRPALHLNVKP